MAIAKPRTRTLLTIMLGLIVSGLTVASTLAAAEHDHDAMPSEKKISKALAALTPAERKQAEAQRYCPIMEYNRLGAEETPHKVTVEGFPIFVCCEGCIDDAVAGGKKTLAKVRKLTKASATLATLPAKDRMAAEAQKYCAVANDSLLGLMGPPIKLELDGKSVFLCCSGCVKKAKANPAATLAAAEKLKKAGSPEDHEGHDHEGHDHEGHDHEGHEGHKH